MSLFKRQSKNSMNNIMSVSCHFLIFRWMYIAEMGYGILKSRFNLAKQQTIANFTITVQSMAIGMWSYVVLLKCDN